MSPLAAEALLFFHPRRGLPSFTPPAVVDELVAAGVLHRHGQRLLMARALGQRVVAHCVGRRRSN